MEQVEAVRVAARFCSRAKDRQERNLTLESGVW